MGIARQLKDEIYRCPPILVLIGRVQDGWLATWSEAEAVVPHPLDPIAVADAVAALMRAPRGWPRSRVTPRGDDLARAARGAAAAARTSTPADTAWAMEQIMRGEATPVQVAGFVVALRAKGETRHRGQRPGPRDARARRADRGGRPGGRHLRHRRRPGPHREHLDDVRDRGRRHRGAGGQARQPGRVLRLRLGRRARGARRRRGPDAGRRRRRVSIEAGIDLLLRARFHPALRHAAIPRRELGVPTIFNFLGPLANPAQPLGAGGRAWPTRGWPADGPGAGRPRGVGTGVPRRRRAGRADADDDLAGLGGARRRGQRPSRSRRRTSGWPAPSRARCAAGTGPQRRGRPAVPGRRDRPGARRGAAQRRGCPGRAGARVGSARRAAARRTAAGRRVGRQRCGIASAGRLGRDQPGRCRRGAGR